LGFRARVDGDNPGGTRRALRRDDPSTSRQWPRRIGFEAAARINRHDIGVSWQDGIPGGGVVVSNGIGLALDVEAILLDDLEHTGAIEYYLTSTDQR
jgi:hypothetical protein